MKKLIALVTAFVLLASSLAAGAVPHARRGSGVGTDISGLSSVDLSGAPVDGSIFAASDLTVINIWQRWCGPCMAELPFFLRLYKHYQAHPESGVQLWGALYYESAQDIEDAVAFIDSEGYTWDQMLVCEELLAVAAAASDDGLISIPQTLIVDRNGVVRAQHRGGFSFYEDLFEFVDPWVEILAAEYASLPGDADGDGEVTLSDALLVLRSAMGILPAEDLHAADMDGNGAVELADALIILRMAMGVV